MKKTISIILSFLMLLSITAGLDFSAYASKAGDYEYQLLDDGTIEITDYYGSAKNLIIPSTLGVKTVTSIGASAFWNCNFTNVTIPNSITSIGNYAFKYCNYLKSVTISDSVTSIGNGAFYDCYSLASITLPNSVTSIGDNAFYDCDSLASITLPDSVTNIGKEIFCDCNNLASITISAGLTNISDYAFYNCTSLASITLPDSVTSIGRCAFEDCTKLTSIEIPDTVTRIGDHAFYYCDSLTGIRIPNGVTSIEDRTFAYCKDLTYIVIPSSVTSIDDYAFYNCDCEVLKEVHYSGSEAEWNSIWIGEENECLKNTTIIYNSTGPIIPIQPSELQPTTAPSGEASTEATTKKPTTTKAKNPAGAKKVDGVWVNTKQKKAAVKKLTNAKKAFKISWKKVSGINGYQIQYSTSKKFTKKTTKAVTISNNKSKSPSKTMKKLKGKKTYYVRIRTYKTVKFNGKNTKVYSSWSKSKAVTTKK